MNRNALNDPSGLTGGYQTARISHAPADDATRAGNASLALAYLTRRGAHDIAQILGLAPTPRPRISKRAPKREPLPDRACEICDRQFTPWDRHSRACSRSCGSKLSARTRAIAYAERRR